MQSIEPPDLVLQFRSYPKLVYVDLVDYFEKFLDQFLLANVLILAIPVSRFRARVVDILGCGRVFQFLVLLLGGYAGLTQSAGKQFCEGEFSILADNLVSCQLLLDFIKKFLGYDWIMLALVPVAGISWSLEYSVVEVVVEDSIYTAESERLVASSVEIQFELEPVVDLSSAPSFIRHFLEHLFDYGRSLRIYDYLALLVHQSLRHVAERRRTRPQSHLASRSQSALHVDASVVVFELRLAAQNHEHKFVVRRIGESLAVGADIFKFAAVHEVDDFPEVACVSTYSIRCPCQDAVVFSLLDLLHDLVENRALVGLLGRVRFALEFGDFQSLALGQLEHFLDLAVDAEHLPFF